MRGYEFAKDQYVQFTDAELESLETESSNNIELKEFIPFSKIDPVYFESAHYVGAGEGGEKPYWPLADALAGSKRAAIAQLVTRGKEQLVLICPYDNGLIMHSLYYANEVRNFADIAKGETAKLSDKEIELGADLIENMSDEFNPQKRWLDCPYVFHYGNGKKVGDFRKAWKEARKTAGLTDVIPHDLRRCAARNLSLSGVNEQLR